MHIQSLISLQNELKQDLHSMQTAIENIRSKLNVYADGKTLKGDEVVGWLGEIYAKLIFEGTVEQIDNQQYDIITKNGDRISVKTRKGEKAGWNQTSAISNIEGGNLPHFLLFIHLREDYIVKEIWFYPWKDLLEAERLKNKKVRGNFRCYDFRVKRKLDNKYLIYSNLV